MTRISGRAARLRMAAVLAVCIALAPAVREASAAEPGSRYPTVRPEHARARALLDDAMRYVDPGNKMVDPVSGYPFEGWNQDPSKGLFLRSFTQLTAIGLYMELLANAVAGYVDSPALPRGRALAQLTHLVDTLRRDQRDPTLGSEGLLVNFLDLATGKRLGPLAADVDRRAIVDAFPGRGEAIWKALRVKGWIAPRNGDREAAIQRDASYGEEHFDGPLAPFGDPATRKKVMEILDQRVVLVVFGDNANLSTSVAKTIGALLTPEVAGRPELAKLRSELEQFLEGQRDGYARLYDPKAGLFVFGRDATRDRLFGWEDAQGRWTTGHMDYFVNEFRGPSTFVAARFGLPAAAIGNLGFKMKPYRSRDGKVIHALAPWEGSAFQAMGLGLSLGETGRPGWGEPLNNVVDIEVDFATSKKLPGFLSESYTGDGVQYTGAVGIPEITVSPKPRITEAASLYSLGVAYTIAPEKVEEFLGANWPLISGLFTDHGPWEGYNVRTREPIRFQTSAHTLSLILGLLGTGSDHMKRYAEHKGFGARLDEFFRTGGSTDLLTAETRAFAWSNKEGRIKSSRDRGAFRVEAERANLIGIAFVPSRPEGVNASGTVLSLRYRSSGIVGPVIIALKPKDDIPPVPGLIPDEIFAHFADTGDRHEELRIPLPATIGLSHIKEVVLTHERASNSLPMDLTITRLGFAPIDPLR